MSSQTEASDSRLASMLAQGEPTYQCAWCGADDLHEDEILAYRESNTGKSVMMCPSCIPENPDEV